MDRVQHMLHPANPAVSGVMLKAMRDWQAGDSTAVAQAIVAVQKRDPTLWREPGSAQEAALQQELARLHAALGVGEA